MSEQALIKGASGLEGRPRLAGTAKALSAVSNAALYLAGIGLVAMSVIVFWQVFLRYVLNWGNAWTELSANLIMSWFIFLGAAVGVRENFHLGFDVLLYAMPRARGVLRTISDLTVLAFGIGMVVYGAKLVALTWNSTLP